LNSVKEKNEEVENVGKCSFEVCPEFFDGIEVRRVGRQVNKREGKRWRMSESVP
jgi:uncharacterized protein YbbK (DUF523 family)